MSAALAIDTRTSVEEALRLFGYRALSADQEPLIQASIAGQDVFGILPTGGGKSACYQIPGVVTGAKTLVISPLIALQEDQVAALRALGIRAFAVHSSMDPAKRAAARFYFKTARGGEASFLYLSPELLLTESFQQEFGNIRFDRVVIDEAHCVSTWGNSFRPDYQRIRLATKRMQIPHCSAFTATVDPKIERDIRNRLPLAPDFLRVAGNPHRPNLILSREQWRTRYEPRRSYGKRKIERLMKLLHDPRYLGPSIVYCVSRNSAATLYLRLREMKKACSVFGHTPYLFHAELPFEDKQATLAGFKNDSYPIVVATTAFGMGIDRADVRQIIHYDAPFTLVDYAQQIGRGGRDGKPTLCSTFHSNEGYLEEEQQRTRFSTPDYDFVERIHGYLKKRIAQTPVAKRSEYTLLEFLQATRRRVERTFEITRKEAYMLRVRAAVVLLQEAGVIQESEKGLRVRSIEPGGELHQKLLHLTNMEERMLYREKERVARFFEASPLSQELLWSILREG